MAAAHPQLVRGAVPIAGGLPKALLPRGVWANACAIHAFHGEADKVVPIGSARDAVKALKTGQRTVTLKTYPGVGHTISRPMRRDVFEALATLAP